MKTSYTPRTTYTTAELDAAALDDLRIDAESAERDASQGGPRAAELTAYAVKCRALMAKYLNGGAHAAVARGEG